MSVRSSTRRPPSKRLLVSILLAAAMTAAACSGSAGTPGARDGQVTITFADGVDIESPNPYAHSSSASYGKWRHVIEALVAWNFETQKFDPVLAESWELENETTWLFHLRNGVVFHDGTPFDAEDVIHSFNRMINDPQSRQAPNFDGIVAMEAVDSHTLRIITDGPFPVLLNYLDNRYITSKEAYEEQGAEAADANIVGTGPYKLNEWIPGTRLVFEKAESYWGKEPLPDLVVFRPILEDGARLAALERGEVDIISNLPPQDAERLDAAPRLSVKTVPSVRMGFFPLNPAIEPFDDVRVRHAINYGINRQQILDEILEGYGDLLPGPLQTNVVGYDPTWEPYPYDPARARTLLAEAGYANGLNITLYSPQGRYLKDLEVSQAIAGQLADIGINVTVETMEWGTFAARYDKGTWGFYHIGRGGIIDGADILAQYFRTGDTTRIVYSNPEVDALLNSADHELDSNKRGQLLQEAGRIILADAPAVFFVTYRDIYGVRDGVEWVPRRDESMLAMDVTAVAR